MLCTYIGQQYIHGARAHTICCARKSAVGSRCRNSLYQISIGHWSGFNRKQLAFFFASKAFRNHNLQMSLVGPEAGNLMPLDAHLVGDHQNDNDDTALI